MNEQMALIEAESDEALLLPDETRRKRYTARQAQKIEERLDLILALMSCNLPLKEVACRAHVNDRTVQQLFALHAGKIASDMARYAGWTSEVSAEFLALARTKMFEAPFKDLIAAHSFVGKLSLDMRLASQAIGVVDGGLDQDVEAESEALVKFRAVLKRLGPAEPEPALEATT